MGLKSLEMQVALPRTQDMGKLQEQMQQRGQHLTEHAAEANRKALEKQRKTVTENTEKEDVKLLNNEENSNESETDEHGRSKTKKDKNQPKENHPYKGKTIDFSG